MICGMEHSDLMKRLNNETNIPPGMEDHIEFGNEWKDMDRQMGHKRYEFKVKVSSIRSAFSKLFGGKKS